MACSSTSTPSDGAQWERLPDELLMRVLGHVKPCWDGRKWLWCGAVRGVSRQWRAVHDAACQSLRLRHGVTDDIMHVLCGQLPAITYLLVGQGLDLDGLWRCARGEPDVARSP
jgi:hypothetical protein